MVERRGCSRKEIKLRMQFKSIKHGVVSDPRETRSVNLSASGLGMKCNNKLEPGQMLLVNVFLPLQDEDDSISMGFNPKEPEYQKVIIYSKVIWCSCNNGHYSVGLHFLELDEYCRQRFKSFLTNYELDWANSHIVN